MKRISKKILALMFSAAFLLGIFPAIPAEAAAIILEPETFVMYQKNQEMYVTFGELSAANAKKSGVKSSNKKVATVVAVENNEYHYEDSYNNEFHKSYNCTVIINVKKPGTTVITCKTGGKTYKKKVVIKKYVNPVSSVTITGINKGKNIAGKTKKKNYVNFKGVKCADSTIKVVPKKGWTIDNISYNNYDTGERSDQTGTYYDNVLQKDVSYNTLNIGKLVKSNSYSITITFTNTSGVSEVIGYVITNNKSYRITGIY